MFSISWSVCYFTISYFSRFLNIRFGIRRMVVQLRRMAFLNKNIDPEGWIFFPLISISSVGTPLILHIWGLHILNYKWINFYQNLSVGSIGWNDLKL